MYHNMAAMEYRRRQGLWESYSVLKVVIVLSVPLTLVLPDALQRCPRLMEKAVDSVTTRHVNSMLVKLQLYQSLWLHLPNWAKTFTVNWITPAAWLPTVCQEPFSKKTHLWRLVNLILNGQTCCRDGRKPLYPSGIRRIHTGGAAWNSKHLTLWTVAQVHLSAPETWGGKTDHQRAGLASSMSRTPSRQTHQQTRPKKNNNNNIEVFVQSFQTAIQAQIL